MPDEEKKTSAHETEELLDRVLDRLPGWIWIALLVAIPLMANAGILIFA